MAFCLITINNLESIWKVWNCNSNNCILLCCFIGYFLIYYLGFSVKIFVLYICWVPAQYKWLLTNISQMHINLFFLTNKILQLQIQYCSSTTTKRKRITITLVAAVVVIIILRNDSAVRLIRILIFFHAKWKVYLALD